MKSCKCGQQLASNARLCPKCGNRFTSLPVKMIAWFFGIGTLLIFILAVIGASTSSTPSSSESPAVKAMHRAVDGEVRLQESLRNPDSFKIDRATGEVVMPDGAICYTYRAQNGFGGMNVGYAVMTPQDVLSTKVSDLKRECAGKVGHSVLTDN